MCEKDRECKSERGNKINCVREREGVCVSVSMCVKESKRDCVLKKERKRECVC